MPFADHNDVVKAFPANRADHPPGIRVLPRRTGRNRKSSFDTPIVSSVQPHASSLVLLGCWGGRWTQGQILACITQSHAPAAVLGAAAGAHRVHPNGTWMYSIQEEASTI